MQDSLPPAFPYGNNDTSRFDHWDWHWAMGDHGLLWWILIGVIVVVLAVVVRAALRPGNSNNYDERLRAIMEDRYVEDEVPDHSGVQPRKGAG